MGIRRESNNEGPFGKFMADANGKLVIPGKPSTPTSTGDATSDVNDEASGPERRPDAEQGKPNG